MKRFAVPVLIALAVLCAGIAIADTVTLGAIYATCDIPDSYVLLKADNLSGHPEWLTNHNTTEEEILADWNARGVLLQAWTVSGDACLEIRAVRDEDAVRYHDIDDQTPNLRATYRREHLSGQKYKALGYNVSNAEWKKTSQGRFLMLKYKCTQDGVTWRGFARKTIKNGYTIILDYRVFGRGLKSGDNNSLNKVWNTWKFTGSVGTEDIPTADPGTLADSVSGGVSVGDPGQTPAEPAPAEATANLKFTSVPPGETNTGKFAVEGTCDAGTQLIGVCMRMDGTDPVIFRADADRRGKFKINVQLPQQGIWLMTVNAEKNGRVVEEYAFDLTNYSGSLLVVNFDTPLPATMDLTGDTLVISGTTVRQTTVQINVDNGYTKQIRTNNSGKFSFKLNTKTDGVYNISLTFSKKNYTTRVFNCVATRSMNDTELREHAVEEAIKPAYTMLCNKTSAYIGRIMTYRMYVVSIAQSGDQWFVQMAQRITSNGYSDIVVVAAKEKPTFEVDSMQQMYGTLVGTYQVQDSVNGDQFYPCFDLIFWVEETPDPAAEQEQV
ncbi:MAG: hypothetical protein IKS31_12745 [Clostridia bacterium]|nr:hypothetical protein [Clostridia bacterium]